MGTLLYNRYPLRGGILLIVCLLAISLVSTPVMRVSATENELSRGEVLIAGEPLSQWGLDPQQVIDIDAPSGLLITRGGTVLWEKNADERRAIASITKVMTAILALESERLDEETTITYEAASIGGSTAGYAGGESHTIAEMLVAMLSVSGNDAAFAIAEHLEDDIETFASRMNAKAADLGMDNTHFTNPQGFDFEGTGGIGEYADGEVFSISRFADDGHYSSARDVARMVTYAMGIERFREIVGNPGDPASLHPNTNELLATYEGANGVKTGMTDAAGNCLAASALRDDIELYAIVLGAATEQARFDEAARLLDFGFAHYGRRVLMAGDTLLGHVDVSDYLDVAVSVGITQEISATYYDLLGPIEHRIDVEPIKAPVEVGTVVGFITFTQNGEQLATAPIVSFEAVEKPGFFEAIGIAFTRFWRSISGSRAVLYPDIIPMTA